MTRLLSLRVHNLYHLLYVCSPLELQEGIHTTKDGFTGWPPRLPDSSDGAPIGPPGCSSTRHRPHIERLHLLLQTQISATGRRRCMHQFFSQCRQRCCLCLIVHAGLSSSDACEVACLAVLRLLPLRYSAYLLSSSSTVRPFLPPGSASLPLP